MSTTQFSRHYYVCDSLDELEKVEEELEANHFDHEQIHVLSRDDAEISQHSHIHAVPSLMQRNIVRSTLKGAAIGIFLAPLMLLVVSYTPAPAAVGWMPFIFLAIVILGFCTWEGGFAGIQEPNKEFVSFNGPLDEGKHVFFVDVSSDQEAKLADILEHHHKLQPAGDGHSTPGLLMKAQHRWHSFRKVFP